MSKQIASFEPIVQHPAGVVVQGPPDATIPESCLNPRTSLASLYYRELRTLYAAVVKDIEECEGLPITLLKDKYQEVSCVLDDGETSVLALVEFNERGEMKDEPVFATFLNYKGYGIMKMDHIGRCFRELEAFKNTSIAYIRYSRWVDAFLNSVPR